MDLSPTKWNETDAGIIFFILHFTYLGGRTPPVYTGLYITMSARPRTVANRMGSSPSSWHTEWRDGRRVPSADWVQATIADGAVDRCSALIIQFVWKTSNKQQELDDADRTAGHRGMHLQLP